MKYNCDCGGKYTYGNKIIHSKTKKHLKYLESLIEPIVEQIDIAPVLVCGIAV